MSRIVSTRRYRVDWEDEAYPSIIREPEPSENLKTFSEARNEIVAHFRVIVAHGKASWMEEVLEKMEASTRTIPLLHHYPVRTDVEEMWEEGNVMLGFDAEERLIQKHRRLRHRRWPTSIKAAPIHLTSGSSASANYR